VCTAAGRAAAGFFRAPAPAADEAAAVLRALF